MRIDWTSENYALLDQEGWLGTQSVQLKFHLKTGKTPVALSRYDIIFHLGYLIVSQKVKTLLQPEAERRWVQFLDIAINGHGVSDDFFALHVSNHEHATDFARSVYEKTGFDGCEEYEFDVQQLKDAFDWDVSIAADADYPTQTIVSGDLCRRLMQVGLKTPSAFTTASTTATRNNPYGLPASRQPSMPDKTPINPTTAHY